MSPAVRVALIAAMGRGRVIGRDGRLPWHMPADLRHFRSVTMGKPVVMGRKTFESIGKPLPGRRTIVLTRDTSYAAPGCAVAHDLEGAFAAAAPCREVVFAGGASVYAQVLALADRLYLTVIEADVEGDARFPPYEHMGWKETARSSRPADGRNPYPCTFLTLER